MLSDRDLIMRAKSGDEAAFTELIRRHGAMVLRLARRFSAQPADAEDIAQEALLRFFRSIERVDPDRPIEPWLVRVTVNASRDAAQRRPREAAGGEDPDRFVGEGPTPESAVADSQLAAVLAVAIGTLPPREREVFVLRDQHGLEVSLIAEALQIAPVTVRRLSMQGRGRIAEWFRKHHPEWLRGTAGGTDSQI